ncbi:sigma E protease regulator RseP [Celerinatantimonas yamalensis]|uniref:Zinc metalloprotease n=1 Tax=Celerinatantimonas yamalensis TaxID=559956 RepID=A0ABW9G834_9GAMM
MQSFIWNAFFFIVALGLLVAIHEFGHFWVARRCGVRVERFSIGFGKKLWSWVGHDGTEYVLALIPLGGYVKMLDERVEPVPAELKHLAFNTQPLWQRALIVAAGPIANFLLAIVAFWLMLMVGIPGVKPILGDIPAGTVAAQSGLRSGQQVIAVNDRPVSDWHAVMLSLISQVGDSAVSVKVKTSNGDIQTHTLDLSNWRIGKESVNSNPLKNIGVVQYQPKIHLQVAQTVANSPAANSGLQKGDKLIAVNQIKLTSWQQFTALVRHHAGSAIELTIERDGLRHYIKVVPEKRQHNGQVYGFMGVAPEVEAFPDDYLITMQYGPLEALVKGTERTWQMTRVTLDMLGKLVSGKVSVENLSGPISIAKGAGQSAHYGFIYFLGFLALVSVNLGILNLVPLPILDGGHLLFFAIEAVTGRPVSERILDVGMRIGASVLVIVMMFALFNDLMRL